MSSNSQLFDWHRPSMTVDMSLLVKLGSPPPRNSSHTAQIWSLSDGYARCDRFIAMFPRYLGTPWKTAIISSVSYMVLVSIRTGRPGQDLPSKEMSSKRSYFDNVCQLTSRCRILTGRYGYFEAHGTRTLTDDPIEAVLISGAIFKTNDQVCEEAGPLYLVNQDSNGGHRRPCWAGRADQASPATNYRIIPPSLRLIDLCEKNTSNPPAKIRARNHCVPPLKPSFLTSSMPPV